MVVNAMIVSIATASGPSIASGIRAISTWHWLFSINIPVGLTAFALGLKFLPKTVRDKSKKFDYLSAIANAITLGLLFYTLDGFAHHNSILRLMIQLAVVFIVGYFFLHRQIHATLPLLPLDLLRIPVFRLSIIASVCSFIAQMLAMISLPFFIQNSMGQTEVTTGLLITAWPVSSMIMGPIAGYMIERIKPTILGTFGLVIFMIGLFLLSFITPHTTHLNIIWRIAVTGLGFTMFQTSNNSLIMSSAPKSRSGSASGMLSLGRLIGQTTGTTLVALLFSFIVKDKTNSVSLLTASGFAAFTALISLWRIRRAREEEEKAQKG